MASSALESVVQTPHPARGARRILLAMAFAMATVMGCAAVAWQALHRGSETLTAPMVVTDAGQVPEALRRPVPAAGQRGPDEGVPPALAADLARIAAAAAASAPGEAGVRQGLDIGLWPSPAAGPRLVLARHDALRDAGTQRPTVALPLFTEEIVVLVRADAPWQHPHQLRGLRLNLGPAGGARAATAAALYRDLFGEAPSATPGAASSAAAALPALLEGRLDAIVLVLPQSPDAIAAALGGPSPTLSQSLRRLSLAPSDAASRRALRAYLPALSLHDAAGQADPVPTLAVMTYLAVDAGDPAAAARVADALCERLPALQRSGHPKWREVDPHLVLSTGVPSEAAAESAWRRCATLMPSTDGQRQPRVRSLDRVR